MEIDWLASSSLRCEQLDGVESLGAVAVPLCFGLRLIDPVLVEAMCDRAIEARVILCLRQLQLSHSLPPLPSPGSPRGPGLLSGYRYHKKYPTPGRHTLSFKPVRKQARGLPFLPSLSLLCVVGPEVQSHTAGTVDHDQVSGTLIIPHIFAIESLSSEE